MHSRCAMLRTDILHVGFVYTTCGTLGSPGIRHVAILQGDWHFVSLYSQIGIKLLQIRLLHLLGSRQEKLIPEQRLQRIEVDTLLLQEVYMIIVGLDILFVITVDDEHIIGGKLQTANLKAQDGSIQL